ncbi:MAG: hypothetical protein NUV64_01955 [Parcubacteria group bacterium]|nr:hypothetical protein [Parcubacteria group bacterium]MCR4342776.1 hypothetical protein [Patescibacteria group bacterium]
MDWKRIPAGTLNAASQRFWGALGDDAGDVARLINLDETYLTLLTDFAKNQSLGGKTLSNIYPQWVRAREIMGANFFGVEEAIRHFGVNPSRAQITALSEVPFTEEVLESCKDTHVLVAVLPMSILNIRGKVERKLFFSHDDAWYNKQAFAKDKGEVGWRLVCKTPVPDSTSKTWDEQQATLDKNDETPKAQVMAYTIIGHYLATGERLFENIYVRCSDLDSDGDRVNVGSFDVGGLSVSYYWDYSRYGYIGVSSARKS